MHWGRFHRRYMGPDSPAQFRGIIEQMSFQLSNLCNESIPVMTLNSNTSRGHVIVQRNFNQEIVWTWGTAGKQYFKIQVFRDDSLTEPWNIFVDPDAYLHVGPAFGSATYSGFSINYGGGPPYDPSWYKYDERGNMLKDGNGDGILRWNAAGKYIELDEYLYASWAPTHPTIPPYTENGIYYPGKIWQNWGGKDEYIDWAEDGIFVLAKVKDSYGCYYRNLDDDEKSKKIWPRMQSYSTWINYPTEKRYTKNTKIALSLFYIASSSTSAGGRGTKFLRNEWDGDTLPESYTADLSIKTSIPYRVTERFVWLATAFSGEKGYSHYQGEGHGETRRGDAGASSSLTLLSSTGTLDGTYERGSTGVTDTYQDISGWTISPATEVRWLEIGYPGPAEWTFPYSYEGALYYITAPIRWAIASFTLDFVVSIQDNYEYSSFAEDPPGWWTPT